MDASHLSSLQTALANTLSSVLQGKYQIDEPSPKSGPTEGHGVTGIVSYTGSLVGTLSLSMSLETAARFANHIEGFPIPEDKQHLDHHYQKSIAETIGELLALIAQTQHLNAYTSCPVVVLGAEHQIVSPPDTPWVGIRCQTPLGEMILDGSLRQSISTLPAAA